MADIREMGRNLKGKEARTLYTENAANKIDHGGRRLGPDRRQFEYSHYFPERRIGPERRRLPERRIDSKLNS